MLNLEASQQHNIFAHYSYSIQQPPVMRVIPTCSESFFKERCWTSQHDKLIKVYSILFRLYPSPLPLPAKGRGDVMVRHTLHSIAVTLSLSKGISPPLTGGDVGEGVFSLPFQQVTAKKRVDCFRIRLFAMTDYESLFCHCEQSEAISRGFNFTVNCCYPLFIKKQER